MLSVGLVRAKCGLASDIFSYNYPRIMEELPYFYSALHKTNAYYLR